jgi:hypothetical protein
MLGAPTNKDLCSRDAVRAFFFGEWRKSAERQRPHAEAERDRKKGDISSSTFVASSTMASTFPAFSRTSVEPVTEGDF